MSKLVRFVWGVALLWSALLMAVVAVPIVFVLELLGVEMDESS